MTSLPKSSASTPIRPGRPTVMDFWRRWLGDHDYFFRMCLRWLRGNRHDAEDVLSRGALNAIEYLRRHPDGVERFRPWILRILHNLCIDTLTAAARRVAPPVQEAEDESETTAVCPRLPPDRALYARELNVALDGAIATLPPRLHGAFRLRFVDDLPYDQISRELAITRENARKRIQQARDLLRERLGPVA